MKLIRYEMKMVSCKRGLNENAYVVVVNSLGVWGQLEGT